MPANPTHSRGTIKTPFSRPKISERGPISQGKRMEPLVPLADKIPVMNPTCLGKVLAPIPKKTWSQFKGLALSSPQISFWKTSQGYKLQRSMSESFLSWYTNPLNSLVIPRLTGL